VDYSIKIGGEAGQGIQTIGDTLAKVFSRSGYHVFTHQDYESRIRGGHNFYQVRFSEKGISASRRRVDIIVALDRESITRHRDELSDNGVLIYDAADLKLVLEGDSFLDVPFTEIALRQGSKILANTVATGAVLGMLRVELDIFEKIIDDTFRKKGDEIVEANRRAARAGHDYAVRNCPKCAFIPSQFGRPKLLINGVEGIALGALASGCRFYAAYPMTPSTGIMNYLAGKAKEYGLIVEQAEDEIAAINMAIGASFAGVRAMTGTAGGGFALMVEGLSLAGMTETPIVIALGQRPAPATGLPTRTEQGDLLFAIHAAHGEFPRVVFAPGTPEQALFLTNKAFDLAEKYQIPTFVVFDQYLADSAWTFDGFDVKRIRYRDYRIRGEEWRQVTAYKRHAFTDNGISPLGVPGQSKNLVVTDSDEHDEEGHIIEDAETRVSMVQKRLLRKLPQIRREIAPPLFYGEEGADTLLVCWGSLYGIVKEVVDALANVRKIGMLHFSELFPLPVGSVASAGDIPVPTGVRPETDFLSRLKEAKASLCVEQNATGQFERFFRAETGYAFDHAIHKYDGRPFTVEELLEKVSACLGRLL